MLMEYFLLTKSDGKVSFDWLIHLGHYESLIDKSQVYDFLISENI